MLSQDSTNPENDVADDSLETELRKKREESMPSPADPDEIESFEPSMKTNHFESKGSFVVELVDEQHRLMRQKRSENRINHSEHVETSLLAFINKSKWRGSGSHQLWFLFKISFFFFYQPARQWSAWQTYAKTLETLNCH